ncbi:MAG: ParB/RepB/Spo0J family partition protein [Gammaproteobacteria bacterium]|nr:ParB/RepB/Spo0J family partition protein [Gammaproteobacteria bacterium]
MEKKRRFNLSKKLQAGIAETINLAESTDGQFRDAEITLSRIEVDPDNPRRLTITLEDVLSDHDFSNEPNKQQEFEQLQELATTIEANGVLNPIVVYRFGEKYRIVAGERRFLASNLAKKQSIPARIYNAKPDDLQLKVVQWVENTAREDLSLAEKISNIESIIKFYTDRFPEKKVDAQELARITGLSLTNTYRFLLLIKSNQKIRHLISSGKLNSLQMAEQLASIKEKEAMDAAIEAFLNGQSLKEIQAIAKDKKAKEKRVTKGRKITNISFGATKNPRVAEMLVKAIVQSESCKDIVDISLVDWNDAKSVNLLIKNIIKKIEGLV